jgi:hypothetical protein
VPKNSNSKERIANSFELDKISIENNQMAILREIQTIQKQQDNLANRFEIVEQQISQQQSANQMAILREIQTIQKQQDCSANRFEIVEQQISKCVDIKCEGKLQSFTEQLNQQFYKLQTKINSSIAGIQQKMDQMLKQQTDLVQKCAMNDQANLDARFGEPANQNQSLEFEINR